MGSNDENLGEKAERAARFEYLMDLYLERRATEPEKDELRALVESGFGNRFKERFDEALNSATADLGSIDMPVEDRQEILINILDRTPDPISKPINWRWAIAAVFILFAAASTWLALRTNLLTSKQEIAAAKKIESSVFTGKQFISLPDGSTVILNEHSTLTYNSAFNKSVREVTLTGEGYFDIHHNPAKPFIVSTGEVHTTVLGTAFNISAYPDREEIKVTVTRGKVQVKNKEMLLGVITPDQQIAVNTLTDAFEKTDTKAEEAVAWKSSYLIFDNMSLEAAAVLMEERFNTKIVFSKEELKACRIHASFLNGESLDKVLSVIGLLLNGKCEKQSDGTVLIDGKGC
jgi:transmembrane sensor